MYSEKPTKNLLTREMIAKDLVQKNKNQAIVFGITFGTMLAAGCVVTTIMGVLFSPKVWHEWLPVGIFAVCFGALAAIFGLGFFFSLRSMLSQLKFSVMVDKVVRKELVRKNRYNVETDEGYPVQRYLYFSKCGKYLTNSFTYEMAEEDDEYYVVVYSVEQPYPFKIYSKKMYEYVDQRSESRHE